MKILAVVILVAHISHGAVSMGGSGRSSPGRRSTSPASPNIYELLNKQQYSQLITAYCPEARAFFTSARIAKYCKSSFDGLVGPDSGSASVDCNQQGYFLTRRSIHEEAEAREISAMVILKSSSLKDRLILAEDCVYQGESVILIHPRVTSLDNMMEQFGAQAASGRNRVEFMSSLTNIYEELAKQGITHGTTLLNAIVVDPNDIARVWLRSFYYCSFENAEYPPVIASGYSLAPYELSTGIKGEVSREKQRLVRLLILIQDYIWPDVERSLYKAYVAYNSSEPKLYYQPSLIQNIKFGNWCRRRRQKQTPEGHLEFILCMHFEGTTNRTGISGLSYDLNRSKEIMK